MIITFEATTIVEELVTDQSPQYLHVGMADENGHYLTFHRTQPFGDGEDWGIYVEVNDQGFSGYGRIATCQLSPTRLAVRFTEPLGSNGQVDGVEVSFAADYRPTAEFVARFQAIFIGSESLLEVTGGRDASPLLGHRLILGGHSFIAPLGADPPATAAEQQAIVTACRTAGVHTFDTTYAPERTALAAALTAADATPPTNAALPIIWNFFGPLTEPLPGPQAWTEARFTEALAELAPWTGRPAIVIHALGDPAEDDRQTNLARRWKAAGRAAAIGVWPGRAWDWARTTGQWDFVVHPLNITTTPTHTKILREAHDHGWTTIATSPFERGWALDRIAAKISPSGTPPSALRTRLADAMLRFTAFAPGIDHVIVAMRSAAYVTTNLTSLSRGPLTPAELSWLQHAAAAAPPT